ncbi:MAG: 50S ribosomal protein L25 [Candidatus Nanopelagicales bacterium]
MQVSITTEPRSDFGKGAARRIRRAGLVPAVIYGHGQELRHVALPDHDLTLALRHAGVVLEVEVDGTKQLVAPRDVQRDPVKRTLEHVDLVIVTRKEAEALAEAAAEAEAAHEAEQAAILASSGAMDTELHDGAEGEGSSTESADEAAAEA